MNNLQERRRARILRFPSAQAKGAMANKTRFESLGVYLPKKVLTTSELLTQLNRQKDRDLEKITGIRERRIAEGESAFDIALSAAQNALKDSQYQPEDIEIIVSTGFPGYANGNKHILESCLSARIKSGLNAQNAIHFDIANAGSGMFSAIAIVDSMIKSGEVKVGLVVSGDTPSQLSWVSRKDKSKEFGDDFLDLTFGDAGASIILDGKAHRDQGLHYLSIFTGAKAFSPGMMKMSSHAAIEETISNSVTHHNRSYDLTWPVFKEALDRTEWSLGEVDAFIPYQTSKHLIRKGKQVIERGFNEKLDRIYIENIESYGHTASTSSFIALHESILSGKIDQGSRIVFDLSAPGYIMGMATYTMDDLPVRYRGRYCMGY
jgi:3-oxoacyl-[acyl-carrier-protein] synthase III